MERKKLNKHRNRVNLTIVLVTSFILSCVAFVAADVTFTTRIKDISVDLGKALNKILELDDIVYTNFTEVPEYVSNVEFNPKGMAGLYNITHIFMDFIQPKELFPKDFDPTDDQGKLDLQKIIQQWPALLKHYAGILALTIIGLLFAILMPFIGFIFCCCRCCGNCGARSQPFDKKHDMCKKVFLAMFLIAIATLILFGVVCAFVSNQHMQEGTEELPTHLRHSVTDVSTYISNTDSHINMLLVKNYQELSDYMSRILQNSSTIITDQLFELSKAVSFTKLQTFVQGLYDIKNNLGDMQNYTLDLRTKASQLNDGLRRVKHELLHTLKDCSNHVTDCKEINNNVSKMETTVDFDSLPDVTKEINELNEHLSKDLIENIKKANEKFQNIPKEIQDAVSTSIPEIQRALDDAGDQLKTATTDIGNTLKDVNNTIEKVSKESIDTTEKLITEYSIYRYYIGLGVSSVLLLVIICVTFGLMCGICGKRPDGYDDDCCNKGAGSKFLMLGVAVMFLFSIILMAVTLIYFLSGVILQRAVCDTLRKPERNKNAFDLMDKQLNLRAILDRDVDSIIAECHANKSAYHVLNLEKKFNISEVPGYLEKFEIIDKINEFKDKIKFPKDITILDDATKDKICKLKNSSLVDLPIHRFIDIMEKDLTSINLNELANELDAIATKLEKQPSGQPYIMSIKQNVMYLRMYQSNLVEPMIETATLMKESAENVESAMKFNHTDLPEAIDATISEVDSAQNYLKENGTEEMKKLADEFGTTVENKLRFYLNLVSRQTENEVGRCGPISNVFKYTLVATCDKILNPWNGFWISVGWCLILFIPTIILSVKLSTLYQKSDPYPGPLVEHEYLYDAYADRDNIPLSNTSVAKKGKKKKKYRGEVYETRGYQGTADGPRSAEPRGPPPRERDAPGGSSHPDTRYADMAPKHWEDYPNGGPPQYQSAPLATEYERPPPYYYPGPGDRP